MLPRVLVSILLVAVATATALPAQCGCGFQNPETQQLFTESLIVYFNETDSIDPNIFAIQDFAHRTEQGWNSIYRQGALPGNVQIANDTASSPDLQVLELVTDPTTSQHLVNGGVLQSVRKDIQYGSFQAALKPAPQWSGGVALSFALNYNTSDSLEMDVLNMDKPTDARISYLVNGEWPAPNTVTNFTILEAAGQQPWKSYTTLRMDWNQTYVAFYIDNNQTRVVTKKDRDLPEAGQPLQLKTWSTGDGTYMEGPPIGDSPTKSHVAWVRAFFNSSTMTKDDHRAFDERCDSALFCMTTDMTLRGSTSYSAASEVRWKQPKQDQGIRRTAGIVAAGCSAFGIFSLLNVFFRRMPWSALVPGRKKRISTEGLRKIVRQSLRRDSPEPGLASDAASIGSAGRHRRTSSKGSASQSLDGSSGWSTPGGIQTPLPVYGAHTPRSGTPAPAYDSRAASFTSLPRLCSSPISAQAGDDSRPSSAKLVSQANNSEKESLKLVTISEEAQQGNQVLRGKMEQAMPKNHIPDRFADTIDNIEPFPKSVSSPTNPFAVTEKGKQAVVTVTELDEKAGVKPAAETKDPAASAKPAPPKRIDYLAGLVGVACIGVTLHHFCQTFWPWVTDGYGPGAHWPKVEKWLAIFVGDYILTPLWIGPFFLTATRFLSTNYLKNGKLEDIAKKELRRMPRLFVPIFITTLLQYFFLSMGLTGFLEILPSVSWSTWPYVVAFPNFGVFINELIELAYLMPNAIPNIVSHYCVGVLWTIPVQLQFTYVVLIATTMIRDIRNPWKRFGFYTVAIVTGWYARSWSACHWAGLVLSDLEATYKWKPYLNKNRIAFWAVLIGACIATLGAPLINIFNQTWSFNIVENSIHPNPSTGAPLVDTQAVYPGYNEPTLSILIFSIGLQIVVELSTWVQAALSTKLVLWLHPHIMTIYLMHGFVMWTWGAWVAVTISRTGAPYWANLIVTCFTTYVWIFIMSYFLTPLMEIPTQGVMRRLDRWTKEEPRPKRPTVAPFTKALVVDRKGADAPAGEI